MNSFDSSDQQDFDQILATTERINTAVGENTGILSRIQSGMGSIGNGIANIYRANQEDYGIQGQQVKQNIAAMAGGPIAAAINDALSNAGLDIGSIIKKSVGGIMSKFHGHSDDFENGDIGASFKAASNQQLDQGERQIGLQKTHIKSDSDNSQRQIEQSVANTNRVIDAINDVSSELTGSYNSRKGRKGTGLGNQPQQVQVLGGGTEGNSTQALNQIAGMLGGILQNQGSLQNLFTDPSADKGGWMSIIKEFGGMWKGIKFWFGGRYTRDIPRSANPLETMTNALMKIYEWERIGIDLSRRQLNEIIKATGGRPQKYVGHEGTLKTYLKKKTQELKTSIDSKYGSDTFTSKSLKGIVNVASFFARFTDEDFKDYLFAKGYNSLDSMGKRKDQRAGELHFFDDHRTRRYNDNILGSDVSSDKLEKIQRALFHDLSVEENAGINKVKRDQDVLAELAAFNTFNRTTTGEGRKLALEQSYKRLKEAIRLSQEKNGIAGLHSNIIDINLGGRFGKLNQESVDPNKVYNIDDIIKSPAEQLIAEEAAELKQVEAELKVQLANIANGKGFSMSGKTLDELGKTYKILKANQQNQVVGETSARIGDSIIPVTVIEPTQKIVSKIKRSIGGIPSDSIEYAGNVQTNLKNIVDILGGNGISIVDELIAGLETSKIGIAVRDIHDEDYNKDYFHSSEMTLNQLGELRGKGIFSGISDAITQADQNTNFKNIRGEKTLEGQSAESEAHQADVLDQIYELLAKKGIKSDKKDERSFLSDLLGGLGGLLKHPLTWAALAALLGDKMFNTHVAGTMWDEFMRDPKSFLTKFKGLKNLRNIEPIVTPDRAVVDAQNEVKAVEEKTRKLEEKLEKAKAKKTDAQKQAEENARRTAEQERAAKEAFERKKQQSKEANKRAKKAAKASGEAAKEAAKAETEAVKAEAELARATEAKSRNTDATKSEYYDDVEKRAKTEAEAKRVAADAAKAEADAKATREAAAKAEAKRAAEKRHGAKERVASTEQAAKDAQVQVEKLASKKIAKLEEQVNKSIAERGAKVDALKAAKDVLVHDGEGNLFKVIWKGTKATLKYAGKVTELAVGACIIYDVVTGDWRSASKGIADWTLFGAPTMTSGLGGIGLGLVGNIYSSYIADQTTSINIGGQDYTVKNSADFTHGSIDATSRDIVNLSKMTGGHAARIFSPTKGINQIRNASFQGIKQGTKVAGGAFTMIGGGMDLWQGKDYLDTNQYGQACLAGFAGTLHIVSGGMMMTGVGAPVAVAFEVCALLCDATNMVIDQVDLHRAGSALALLKTSIFDYAFQCHPETIEKLKAFNENVSNGKYGEVGKKFDWNQFTIDLGDIYGQWVKKNGTIYSQAFRICQGDKEFNNNAQIKQRLREYRDLLIEACDALDVNASAVYGKVLSELYIEYVNAHSNVNDADLKNLDARFKALGDTEYREKYVDTSYEGDVEHIKNSTILSPNAKKIFGHRRQEYRAEKFEGITEQEARWRGKGKGGFEVRDTGWFGTTDVDLHGATQEVTNEQYREAKRLTVVDEEGRSENMMFEDSRKSQERFTTSGRRATVFHGARKAIQGRVSKELSTQDKTKSQLSKYLDIALKDKKFECSEKDTYLKNYTNKIINPVITYVDSTAYGQILEFLVSIPANAVPVDQYCDLRDGAAIDNYLKFAKTQIDSSTLKNADGELSKCIRKPIFANCKTIKDLVTAVGVVACSGYPTIYHDKSSVAMPHGMSVGMGTSYVSNGFKIRESNGDTKLEHDRVQLGNVIVSKYISHYIQNLGNTAMLPASSDTSVSDIDFQTAVRTAITGSSEYNTDVSKEVESDRSYLEKLASENESFSTVYSKYKMATKDSSLSDAEKNKRLIDALDVIGFDSSDLGTRAMAQQFVEQEPDTIVALITTAASKQDLSKKYEQYKKSYIGSLKGRRMMSSQQPQKFAGGAKVSKTINGIDSNGHPFQMGEEGEELLIPNSDNQQSQEARDEITKGMAQRFGISRHDTGAEVSSAGVQHATASMFRDFGYNLAEDATNQFALSPYSVFGNLIGTTDQSGVKGTDGTIKSIVEKVGPYIENAAATVKEAVEPVAESVSQNAAVIKKGIEPKLTTLEKTVKKWYDMSAQQAWDQASKAIEEKAKEAQKTIDEDIYQMDKDGNYILDENGERKLKDVKDLKGVKWFGKKYDALQEKKPDIFDKAYTDSDEQFLETVKSINDEKKRKQLIEGRARVFGASKGTVDSLSNTDVELKQQEMDDMVQKDHAEFAKQYPHLNDKELAELEAKAVAAEKLAEGLDEKKIAELEAKVKETQERAKDITPERLKELDAKAQEAKKTADGIDEKKLEELDKKAKEAEASGQNPEEAKKLRDEYHVQKSKFESAKRAETELSDSKKKVSDAETAKKEYTESKKKFDDAEVARGEYDSEKKIAEFSKKKIAEDPKDFKQLQEQLQEAYLKGDHEKANKISDRIRKYYNKSKNIDGTPGLFDNEKLSQNVTEKVSGLKQESLQLMKILNDQATLDKYKSIYDNEGEDKVREKLLPFLGEEYTDKVIDVLKNYNSSDKTFDFLDKHTTGGFGSGPVTPVELEFDEEGNVKNPEAAMMPLPNPQVGKDTWKDITKEGGIAEIAKEVTEPIIGGEVEGGEVNVDTTDKKSDVIKSEGKSAVDSLPSQSTETAKKTVAGQDKKDIPTETTKKAVAKQVEKAKPKDKKKRVWSFGDFEHDDMQKDFAFARLHGINLNGYSGQMYSQYGAGVDKDGNIQVSDKLVGFKSKNLQKLREQRLAYEKENGGSKSSANYKLEAEQQDYDKMKEQLSGKIAANNEAYDRDYTALIERIAAAVEKENAKIDEHNQKFGSFGSDPKITATPEEIFKDSNNSRYTFLDGVWDVNRFKDNRRRYSENVEDLLNISGRDNMSTWQSLGMNAVSNFKQQKQKLESAKNASQLESQYEDPTLLADYFNGKGFKDAGSILKDETLGNRTSQGIVQALYKNQYNLDDTFELSDGKDKNGKEKKSTFLLKNGSQLHELGDKLKDSPWLAYNLKGAEKKDKDILKKLETAYKAKQKEDIAKKAAEAKKQVTKVTKETPDSTPAAAAINAAGANQKSATPVSVKKPEPVAAAESVTTKKPEGEVEGVQDAAVVNTAQTASGQAKEAGKKEADKTEYLKWNESINDKYKELGRTLADQGLSYDEATAKIQEEIKKNPINAARDRGCYAIAKNTYLRQMRLNAKPKQELETDKTVQVSPTTKVTPIKTVRNEVAEIDSLVATIKDLNPNADINADAIKHYGIDKVKKNPWLATVDFFDDPDSESQAKEIWDLEVKGDKVREASGAQNGETVNATLSGGEIVDMSKEPTPTTPAEAAKLTIAPPSTGTEVEGTGETNTVDMSGSTGTVISETGKSEAGNVQLAPTEKKFGGDVVTQETAPVQMADGGITQDNGISDLIKSINQKHGKNYSLDDLANISYNDATKGLGLTHEDYAKITQEYSKQRLQKYLPEKYKGSTIISPNMYSMSGEQNSEEVLQTKQTDNDYTENLLKDVFASNINSKKLFFLKTPDGNIVPLTDYKDNSGKVHKPPQELSEFASLFSNQIKSQEGMILKKGKNGEGEDDYDLVSRQIRKNTGGLRTFNQDLIGNAFGDYSNIPLMQKDEHNAKYGHISAARQMQELEDLLWFSASRQGVKDKNLLKAVVAGHDKSKWKRSAYDTWSMEDQMTLPEAIQKELKLGKYTEKKFADGGITEELAKRGKGLVGSIADSALNAGAGALGGAVIGAGGGLAGSALGTMSALAGGIQGGVGVKQILDGNVIDGAKSISSAIGGTAGGVTQSALLAAQLLNMGGAAATNTTIDAGRRLVNGVSGALLPESIAKHVQSGTDAITSGLQTAASLPFQGIAQAGSLISKGVSGITSMFANGGISQEGYSSVPVHEGNTLWGEGKSGKGGAEFKLQFADGGHENRTAYLPVTSREGTLTSKVKKYITEGINNGGKIEGSTQLASGTLMGSSSKVDSSARALAKELISDVHMADGGVQDYIPEFSAAPRATTLNTAGMRQVTATKADQQSSQSISDKLESTANNMIASTVTMTNKICKGGNTVNNYTTNNYNPDTHYLQAQGLPSDNPCAIV